MSKKQPHNMLRVADASHANSKSQAMPEARPSRSVASHVPVVAALRSPCCRRRVVQGKWIGIQWTVFPDRSNDQILDERKGKARLKIGHARSNLF